MDREVIWILRGAQRKELFLSIPEKEFMPNRLRKELNEKKSLTLSLREISRHLNDFEEKGFVKCLNPSDPYNKIYLITSKGKKIKQNVLNTQL